MLLCITYMLLPRKSLYYLYSMTTQHAEKCLGAFSALHKTLPQYEIIAKHLCLIVLVIELLYIAILCHRQHYVLYYFCQANWSTIDWSTMLVKNSPFSCEQLCLFITFSSGWLASILMQTTALQFPGTWNIWGVVPEQIGKFFVL